MIAQKKLTSRERMIAAIGNLPDWFSTSEASRITGMTTNTCLVVLNRMLEDCEVDRLKTSKTRNCYLYCGTPKLGFRKRKDHQEEPEVVDNGIHNIFVEIIKKGHDEDFQDKPPSSATGAIPGSPEKVEVMRQRVERGESPNHPGDLRGGSQLGAIPRFAIRVSGVGGIREVGA